MREPKPAMTPAPARGDRVLPSIAANVPSPPEGAGFHDEVLDELRDAMVRDRAARNRRYLCEPSRVVRGE